MTNAMSVPEKRYRAARVVAANARNANDFTELLNMLGLAEVEGQRPPMPADPLRIPTPRHSSDAERDLAITILAAITGSLR
jgi:hypothetical protein